MPFGTVSWFLFTFLVWFFFSAGDANLMAKTKAGSKMKPKPKAKAAPKKVVAAKSSKKGKPAMKAKPAPKKASAKKAVPKKTAGKGIIKLAGKALEAWKKKEKERLKKEAARAKLEAQKEKERAKKEAARAKLEAQKEKERAKKEAERAKIQAAKDAAKAKKEAEKAAAKQAKLEAKEAEKQRKLAEKLAKKGKKRGDDDEEGEAGPRVRGDDDDDEADYKRIASKGKGGRKYDEDGAHDLERGFKKYSVGDLEGKIADEIAELREHFAWQDIVGAIGTLDFFIDAKNDECIEKGCDNIRTTQSWCRLHYLKNWKTIQRKKEILKEGRLQEYIEELISKYPAKYIEAIMNDLGDDKEFYKVLNELNITNEFDFEEDEFEADVDDDNDDDLGVERFTGTMRYEDTE